MCGRCGYIRLGRGESPFLSALAGDVTLPVIGVMHLSTVLLFDLGVFLLVVGATVLILVALAHQSRRGHRRPGAVPVEGKEAIGHAAPAAATSPVAAARVSLRYPRPPPRLNIFHLPSWRCHSGGGTPDKDL